MIKLPLKIFTISIISLSCVLIIFTIHKYRNNEKPKIEQVLHPSKFHNNDGFPYVPNPMGKNQIIPRIIHQTYKAKTRNEMSSGMFNASSTFSNSKFEYNYYNDEAVLKFLIDNYGESSDEIGCFYKIGGFYADIDSILLKDLDTWIENNATLVLPVGFALSAWFGFEFAFIGSVPQHPLLRIAMDMIIYNVKNKFIPEVPRKLEKLDFFLDFLTISGPVLMGKAFNRYLNEPDEAPHNIVKGRSVGIQFLGFCDNAKQYFTTIPHQRNLRECRGQIVIQFRYDQYWFDRKKTNKPYWENFWEGKVFRNTTN